jgi:hypothetical protein
VKDEKIEEFFFDLIIILFLDMIYFIDSMHFFMLIAFF